MFFKLTLKHGCLFLVLQWISIVAWSTLQQRACVYWEREGRSLLAWSSSTSGCQPGASGFLSSKFRNFYLHRSFLSCLLIPTVSCHPTKQVKKMMANIRQYQVPLQRYMAMMDLQVLGQFSCYFYLYFWLFLANQFNIVTVLRFSVLLFADSLVAS